MARVPGMFNGGVPPNIEWNENDPPVRYTCSAGVMHLENCDGSCGVNGFLSKVEVEFLNEHREWARVGMTTSNINVASPFEVVMKLDALIEFLVSKDLLDIDELNDFYREKVTERMRMIRKENEETVKRARLGLPPNVSGIIGPDGKPLI